MIEWKTDGRSHELKIGRFRLTVHHHIHYPPDMWLASEKNLFRCVELKAKTAYAAKIEAWQMLRGVLREALYAMQPDCSKCRNKKQSIADAVFCDAAGGCHPEYEEVSDE